MTNGPTRVPTVSGMGLGSTGFGGGLQGSTGFGFYGVRVLRGSAGFEVLQGSRFYRVVLSPLNRGRTPILSAILRIEVRPRSIEVRPRLLRGSRGHRVRDPSELLVHRQEIKRIPA